VFLSERLYPLENKKTPEALFLSEARIEMDSVTMNAAWDAWKQSQLASVGEASAPTAIPPVLVPVPDAITNAWQSQVVSLESTMRVELDASRLSIRREADDANARALAAEAEKTALAEDGLRLQDELEQAEADAAKAADAAAKVIAERDAIIAGLQADLVELKGEINVRNAELVAAKLAADKAENALKIAQEAERGAHNALATQAAQVSHLSDELTAAGNARVAAEHETTTSRGALQTLEGRYNQQAVELSAATTLATERATQLTAADARADKAIHAAEDRADKAIQAAENRIDRAVEAARQHGEDVAEKLRQAMAEMEKELAALRPPAKA
jgi:DNA repair exonuclease SbcCD ATPase subunit